MGRTRRINSKPKTGDYRNGKKERWNGYKWVKVNVVHKGQKATLNGKSVTADGRGNWVIKGKRRNRSGTVVGRYAPGERVKTTPLPTIAAKDRPKDMQSGKVYGDAGQPPAPKLPPKPTNSKAATTTKPAAPRKPATPAPTKKAQSSADNMRAWALANKKMIEKSGTKTQKAILAKALKPKKKKSSALAIGGYS